MGEKIQAGVVVVTKFVQSGSDVFAEYIDYINRSEAVRNESYAAYSLYNEYMDNPEKTTALFTETDDGLDNEEKIKLKDIFEKAQENGSLMWQTVISFDNRWLNENGLMDIETMEVDEGMLREVTRSMMLRLKKDEGLENASWSAAVHYNTDNLHIHIAMVEPVPTRERGKFKLGSIQRARSRVVNQIMSQQQENTVINSLIRESIAGADRSPLLKDRRLAEKFREIHRKLPLNKQLWKYNMNALNGIRPYIDSLSREFISLYHGKEFDALMKNLNLMDKKYRKAYGKTERSFAKTKLDELYTRMGNSILKEMKEYDRLIKSEKYQKEQKKKTRNLLQRRPRPQEHSQVLNTSLAKLKQSLSDDFRHVKNLHEYEYMIEHKEETI